MNNQQKKMVSPAEASTFFSIAPGTLANWRSMKKGPPYFRVNRKILYRLEDLEDFFTREPVLTTDSLPKAK